ncbi:hypothetical protein Tco_0860259, partial [Tanacetum coccineum]
MDSDKYLEGQSMQRPPLFESDSFIYWKNRFETYVKSKDLDLWHVITNVGFDWVSGLACNLLALVATAVLWVRFGSVSSRPAVVFGIGSDRLRILILEQFYLVWLFVGLCIYVDHVFCWPSKLLVAASPQVSSLSVGFSDSRRVKFHGPFAGLNGCHGGNGNGLTKNYFITHLRDGNFCGEAQAITKRTLLSDLVMFERTELTLKQMGLWLCGVCFTTHTILTKCRHGNGFVPPPDNGDGEVRFVLYALTKPLVPSCSQPDLVEGLVPVEHDGFTLSLLDSLFSK